MRLPTLWLTVLALLAPLAALAQEQAFTNRATELRERGAADAPAVASLPENTQLKVVSRAGAWTRVEANGQSGWVRAFHLRFAPQVQAQGGGGLGAIGSVLGLGGARSESTKLASTGIRGLSQEDLKNASPDPQQLRRMQSYRSDRADAERFAREAKLAESKVGEPKGEGQ